MNANRYHDSPERGVVRPILRRGARHRADRPSRRQGGERLPVLQPVADGLRPARPQAVLSAGPRTSRTTTCTRRAVRRPRDNAARRRRLAGAFGAGLVDRARVGPAGAPRGRRDVPRPVARTESSILRSTSATRWPRPRSCATSACPARAGEVLDRLLWNVELFLDHNWIHADCRRSTSCGGREGHDHRPAPGSTAVEPAPELLTRREEPGDHFVGWACGAIPTRWPRPVDGVLFAEL
jgi:hypothetical protein